MLEEISALQIDVGELPLIRGSVFTGGQRFRSFEFMAPIDQGLQCEFKPSMVSYGRGSGEMNGSFEVAGAPGLSPFNSPLSTDDSNAYVGVAGLAASTFVQLKRGERYAFSFVHSNQNGRNIATYFNIVDQTFSVQGVVPVSLGQVWRSENNDLTGGPFKLTQDGVIIVTASAVAVGQGTGDGGISKLQIIRQSAGGETEVVAETVATAGWSLHEKGSDHKNFDALLTAFVRAGDRISVQGSLYTRNARTIKFVKGTIHFYPKKW